jgi:hypothetical protein
MSLCRSFPKPAFFAGLRGGFEFDRIAVGIFEIDRSAVSIGSVSDPSFSGINTMLSEVASDLFFVELHEVQSEMIDVMCSLIDGAATCLTERRSDVHEVHQAIPRSQLNEPEFVESSFDWTAKHVSIELDGPIKI